MQAAMELREVETVRAMEQVGQAETVKNPGEEKVKLRLWG
jgi:hypothetical protein